MIGLNPKIYAFTSQYYTTTALSQQQGEEQRYSIQKGTVTHKTPNTNQYI